MQKEMFSKPTVSAVHFGGVTLVPVLFRNALQANLASATDISLYPFLPSYELHSFTASQLHSFTASQLHNFTTSQLHNITTSQYHNFTISQYHNFTASVSRNFTRSQLPLV
jgi:hypothetical protein